MGLKTKVLVNQINNLSDARYCAGMGADYLGFNLEPKSDHYLDPEKFKELISWVSGPEFVGEFHNTPVNEIINISSLYSIDHIQITDIQYIKELKKLNFSTILEISSEYFTEQLAQEYHEGVFYFLVKLPALNSSEYSRISALAEQYPILLGGEFQLNQVNQIVKDPFNGIAIQGGEEIKPGFREFDEMADILEMLEIED